jgi:hypothetical protein
VVLSVGAWAGISAAVSGGGYEPDQQDCTPNANAFDATGTEAGCHNLAVNVEGGGTTNGNASSSNPRYVEYGGNQLPNTDEPNTPTVLGLGYPGQDNAQHAGCLSVDTNPTGGGTGTGCGSGGGGLGLSTTYDYWNTVQPGYTYVPVPFPDPFSLFSGKPQLGTFPVPVPNPTATKVKGGSPVSPTLDTNAAGLGGSDSIVHTFLTQGLLVYFGMDDNNDAGEHDGVDGQNGTSGVFNGSSDGGGMTLSITPQAALAAFSATNPEGAVNYSEGECADGICSAFTTQQQTVYYGCGTNADTPCAANTPGSEPVFENKAPSSTQEPSDCSSGDATSETCADGSSLNTYRSETPQQMNTEPGIQTYQDPDPQRSPALPFGTPGIYVGTCGLFLNDSGGAGSPGITGQDPGWIAQPLGTCGS